MKKITIMICGVAMLCMAGCAKKSDNAAPVSQEAVINDFVNKVALPQYRDLLDRATVLNEAISTLNTTPSNASLDAARSAWRSVRAVWEQCEGFLIGPVEDDNYDPDMDTWPVDYVQLDSFIHNSSSLNIGVVENLNQALRGFHPLEYILWGKGGGATIDSISAKDKQYMMALGQDILNNVTKLNTSWAANGGNFQAKLITAGSGSTLYPKRVDAVLALVAGMSAICEEVGGGKIKEPFAAIDSTLTESPFSHNSIADFTNNIVGAQNVYLCSYNNTTGTGISNFVNARNIQLDNKIKGQFAVAIAALGNVTASFEMGVYTQRNQLQTAITAINALQTTLDGELKTFVQTYGKD